MTDVVEGNWRDMGKYQIIYADPPWSYDDKALNRGGAERHYSTMRLEDICALPVAEIAADDALLFMWGAWPKLFEAKAVIEAWGFEFKTCAFVWVKTNKRTNPDQWGSLGVFAGEEGRGESELEKQSSIFQLL